MQKNHVYVVIRVPKCGSTSLSKMFINSFPGSSNFSIYSSNYELMSEDRNKISFIEKFRILKNTYKRNWKNYKRLSFKSVWEKTNQSIIDGDIIHGHLTIDSIRLKNVNKRLITLIRDPYERMLSDYNYSKNSYKNKNSPLKKFNKRLYVAANYSLEGYISYLKETQPIFGRYISRFVIGKESVSNNLEFMNENYFSYGLLERMDLFIEDFYKKTNVRLIQQKSNITKNKRKINLSESEKRSISKFCEEDIALYNEIQRSI
jgi:hypothetical protein